MATTGSSRFAIFSDALNERDYFDPRYTCDADNSSPELRWTSPATGGPPVAGFALIVEDPDTPSGLYTHWVVYNIPPAIRHLPAGIPSQETLPNGIRQGLNGSGKLGYTGPCPPLGNGTHRYTFRIYALAALPTVPPRATRDIVLLAISPFILATAEFQGQYKRSAQRAG